MNQHNFIFSLVMDGKILNQKIYMIARYVKSVFIYQKQLRICEKCFAITSNFSATACEYDIY